MILLLKTTVKVLKEWKMEAARDWAIAKTPMLVVVLMGFVDALKYIKIKFPLDEGIFTTLSALVVLDIVSGTIRAVAEERFTFKKFSNGILKKVLKWGTSLAFIAILSNAHLFGKEVGLFSNGIYLIAIAIISVEANSNSRNIFGLNIETLINRGSTIVKKVVPKKAE